MTIWIQAAASITVIAMISPILSNRIYTNREQSFRGSASLSKTVFDTSYKSIKTDSADYIKRSYSILKSWCHNTVEVNVESERLMDIVKSGEPHIFIMNHTYNQIKDIKTAKFFNTLLYREYIYNNKAADCPRSKVIANKKIIQSQPDGGDLYEWLGVTPISVSITGRHKRENQSVINDLAKQLGEGKINLFIFPEGALCMFPFLPLNYKFQPGVSSIVKKVLELRDKIKVVPVGLAHNKEVSSAHMGEPVCFTKENGKYSAKIGEKYIPLTEQGKPVNREHVIPYISGVLVNSLKQASKDAKNNLKREGEVYTLW